MRRPTTHSEPIGRQAGEQVYYVTHEPATPGGLTATLTHAIADLAGVDVTVAELAVGDRVDPAALDRLFRDSGRQPASGHLSLGFDLWEYRVTVRADGVIEIRPPTNAGQPRGSAGHGGPQSPSQT